MYIRSFGGTLDREMYDTTSGGQGASTHPGDALGGGRPHAVVTAAICVFYMLQQGGTRKNRGVSAIDGAHEAAAVI